MDIHVNDVLKMKKAHPCGSQEWLVLRVGMDFKLRCQGCGREVMLPREQGGEECPEGVPGRSAGGSVGFLQGEFRRLRAASFFLDAQKEAKEAPGGKRRSTSAAPQPI